MPFSWTTCSYYHHQKAQKFDGNAYIQSWHCITSKGATNLPWITPMRFWRKFLKKKKDPIPGSSSHESPKRYPEYQDQSGLKVFKKQPIQGPG